MKVWIVLLFAVVFSSDIFAQGNTATISGLLKNNTSRTLVSYANVVLKHEKDSIFITGTISDENGRFLLNNIKEGRYFIEISSIGYLLKRYPVLVGRLNNYFDLGSIELEEEKKSLQEVVITAQTQDVQDKMDKKSYKLSDNISQGGGSVLQSMKNLPGITVNEDGKVLLRGSSRVVVLVDGQQTALTGFGNQAALDNIPASAIERIELINNPSAKFDANGNAGIINIIYKKTKQNGFNGKAGITTGLGALWIKEPNLPGIRPQYQATPKINPSLSLNYRKDKINAFFQGDYLYSKTLNKNEFSNRYYDNGDTIRQQVKRNRITTVGSGKAGIDWYINNNNSITFSGLFSNETVHDYGDIPYFNGKLTERNRLWQFFEDEVNTAATASAAFQHKFSQPGHLLNINLNYTFHREDEKYFLVNTMPSFVGRDTFMLIADEKVTDLNLDYMKPFRKGRLESGAKLRYRYIPTNMQFYPGIQSPLDVNAAGWAKYKEIIPAVYGNYIYETKQLEVEAGLRIEYVDLQYTVNPNHNTYRSDGYNYFEPFPSIRVGYNLNENNKLSLFYNRRVDRPDEGDIRIFPKYDDPEILKVGNPGLRPQFTQSVELGYKTNWENGYFYLATYRRKSRNAITRIGTTVPNSNIIYTVFQNADNAYNTGIELVTSHKVNNVFSFNLNVNFYQNKIGAFTVENKYPAPVMYSTGEEKAYSGSIKLNGLFHLPKDVEVQLTTIYLAPDIIPLGKIAERFSVDLGVKKSLQKKQSELFLNCSDLFNTLRIEKEIRGNTFRVISSDFYETQVFRVGYNYKF